MYVGKGKLNIEKPEKSPGHTLVCTHQGTQKLQRTVPAEEVHTQATAFFYFFPNILTTQPHYPLGFLVE